MKEEDSSVAVNDRGRQDRCRHSCQHMNLCEVCGEGVKGGAGDGLATEGWRGRENSQGEPRSRAWRHVTTCPRRRRGSQHGCWSWGEQTTRQRLAPHGAPVGHQPSATHASHLPMAAAAVAAPWLGVGRAKPHGRDWRHMVLPWDANLQRLMPPTCPWL